MADLPSLGPRGEGWVVIQLVLLLGVLVAGPLGGPSWTGIAADLAFILGVALAILALAMLVAAAMKLGRGLTPLPRPRDDGAFVQDGIYGRVRHPMYGALVLGAIGWSLAYASIVALVVSLILLGFFILKSQREEAWLRESYPTYSAYAGRTHRLIPWIL